MEPYERKEEESVLEETKVVGLLPRKRVFFEPSFALYSIELVSDLQSSILNYLQMLKYTRC